MREIRRGGAADLPVLADIFWRGVHDGAAPKYTPAQRHAWLPDRPHGDGWTARLAGQAIFVATQDGTHTGFMTLKPDGYLDFAYVLPDARGTGTADALLAVLMNHAAVTGTLDLKTRASDMARPVFARNGWHAVGPAPQMRQGVVITATDMAMSLRP